MIENRAPPRNEVSGAPLTVNHVAMIVDGLACRSSERVLHIRMTVVRPREVARGSGMESARFFPICPLMTDFTRSSDRPEAVRSGEIDYAGLFSCNRSQRFP